MRILLIEDDEALADMLFQCLTSQHYAVDMASDGQMGWEYAQGTPYDLILIDVGLPKLDGITLCKRLRSQGCSTPILLMTATDATSDRIQGLDAGADDYLIKPLNLDELQARVRALLRRGNIPTTPILQVGELQLDPSSCKVTFARKPLSLTPKEYNLLELFMRNPSRVFSRGNIVEHLWTYDDPPQEETVKAHIKGLRQKLKIAGAENWIENVYGIGYRLNPNIDSASRGLREQRTPGAEDSGRENINTAAASTEQKFNQAMDKMWQKYEGLMRQRLEVLQQAATAVKTKNLSQELRQEATKAAHKLAGVLGMFELETGTKIAADMERILSGNDNLTSTQKRQVRSQIETLSNLLNQKQLEVAQRNDNKIGEAEPLSIHSQAEPGNELNKEVNTVSVLVVDDDPAFLGALRPILEPWGIRMTGLDEPLRFWEVLPQVSPDLLILDVEMPQVSGVELCQNVRKDANWQELPILFLTAHRELETIQQVFAVGADDYVVKPVVGTELLTRITNRLERNRLLKNLATKEPITGLSNQRKSSQNLENLIEQAGKNNGSFCLAILVVNRLRQINIQCGHAVGDRILQQWGNLLKKTFPAEVTAYWGNGEFVLGMPGMSKLEAGDRISDLLTALRTQVFTAPDETRFQVDFGVALAEYPTDGITLQSLYQIASSTLL
ncbi:MAG TPA: hypothetical protein DDW76_17740 [Cyanobacteria bacterium UBA11369]|nr:hypothetical protein [Cyanobacteria bacterium UBA11371]HBE50587.1 hypothetical protein [Cyanobacteria bacterium UBA11369]